MITPVNAEDRARDQSIRYSICTLVTQADQYEAMIATFKSHGFDGDCVEYLFVDNSNGNRLDGYSGCNLFLNVARGAYVILCHQDVRLESDGVEQLDRAIAQLDARDPSWAVCGNAGGVSPGRIALRISDPHGDNQKLEDLPARVSSLDENFIVVKRSANLALSRDLSGFHLYGADLCIIADLLGYSAYVIDFHLRHLSGGMAGGSLDVIRDAMARKYAKGLRSRWITTTCAVVFLSGVPLMSSLFNSGAVTRAARRLGGMLAKRNRSAGWP